MTNWDDNNFPDADDPIDVGWMISYWRIRPCETGCKDGYALDSRQFDHLPLAATRAEAVELWRTYVRQKRRSGKQNSLKGLNIFLTKVVKVGVISDNTGEMDLTRGDAEDST